MKKVPLENITLDKVFEVVQKLGGVRGINQIISGESEVQNLNEPHRHCWYEEKGVVYCHVVSHGAAWEWWKNFCRQKALIQDVDSLFRILRSPHFKKTSGVQYSVAIVKPRAIRGRLHTEKFHEFAKKHSFTRPTVELGFLLAEKLRLLNFEAMGLKRIIVPHPDVGEYTWRTVLGLHPDSHKKCSLFAYLHNGRWDPGTGLAYIVSQSKVPL